MNTEYFLHCNVQIITRVIERASFIYDGNKEHALNTTACAHVHTHVHVCELPGCGSVYSTLLTAHANASVLTKGT